MDRFLHGGNVYKETSPTGKWLDFSANINPMGIPDSVRHAILEHLDDIVHYPEPDAPKLKTAISDHYDIPFEQIIPGNGAAELFYLFFNTIRPKRVIIPVPSFGEYERSALAAGASPVFLPLDPENDFTLNMNLLKDMIPQADCLILGNPNNPTGRLLSCDFLIDLSKFCNECNCWLFLDESFLDFRHDWKNYTIRNLVGNYPKLFITQSMTKFYAIPGLRLGFGIASDSLIHTMENSKDVWNVNQLAQYAGIAALSDEEYAAKTRVLLHQEQSFLVESLKRMKDITPLTPTVNFMLLKLSCSKLVQNFLKCMKQRGILLRECSNYRGLESGEYLRMAIRSHDENLRLIEAFNEILQEEGCI